MPPKRAQRSRSRQTTPQSPPRQAAPESSPRFSRRGTRSVSREQDQRSVQRKQPGKSLPIVDEEFDVSEEIEVLEIPARSDQDDAQSTTNDRDVSGDDMDDTSSNGTTQLEALDTDLIIDNLPALHQAATKILSLFDPDDALQFVSDTKDPSSKASKRLLNFHKQLESSREAYGSGSYIDVQLVDRKVLGDSNVHDGPWRPDAILQLANLSLFVVELLNDNRTAIADTLERMFNTFPEPFGNFHVTIGRTRYSTQLIDQNVTFGIDLRTQFFLMMALRSRHDAAFDPDSILQQVFFQDDRPRGFSVDDDDISTEIQTAVLRRVKKIRQSFTKSGTDSIDLKHLQQKFSWTKFLGGAFQWVYLRQKALDTQITQQGGVDAIKDRLEQSDFMSYDRYTPHAQATTDTSQYETIRPGIQNKKATQSTPKRTATPRTSDQMAKRIARLKSIQAQEDDYGSDKSKDDEPGLAGIPQHTPVQGLDNRSRSVLAEIPQSPEAAMLDDQVEDTSGDNNNVDNVEENGEEIPEEAVVDGQAEGADDEYIANVDEEEEEEAVMPGDDQVDEIGGDNINIDDGDGDGEEGEEEEAAAVDVEAHVQETNLRSPSSTIIPTQKTLAVLEVAREQAAISRKENIDPTRRSYIDKQATAKRLAWDESQPGQKRARRETDSGGEESDEYETDTRPQKRQRLPRPQLAHAAEDWIAADGDDDEDEIEQQASQQLRTALRPPSTQPLSHRSPPTNRSRHTNPPSSSAPQPQSRARHQPVPSIRSASAQPEADQDSDPDPDNEAPSSPQAIKHRTINTRAKSNMRNRISVLEPTHPTTRAPQIRRAWTVAETARLFDMIAQHGCQWAFILEQDREHPDGPELQHRGQVQLKDKARNLKMDYLKAGEALPDGFHGVTIKQTDRDLLRSIGQPYE